MSHAPESAADAPLDDEARARGRRLAITGHPAGMTFRMVFSQHLPTLALVALGASELLVGVQNALVFACIALQLPVLRLVAILPNLVSSQVPGISYSVASFYGGTGLLIAVSVAFDLVQKINSHLVMRNYRGLLEKG